MMFNMDTSPLFLEWLDGEVDKCERGEDSPLLWAWHNLCGGVPITPRKDALTYVIVEAFQTVRQRDLAFALNMYYSPNLTREQWAELVLHIPLQILGGMMALSEDPGLSWH